MSDCILNCECVGDFVQLVSTCVSKWFEVVSSVLCLTWRREHQHQTGKEDCVRKHLGLLDETEDGFDADMALLLTLLMYGQKGKILSKNTPRYFV